MAQRIRIVLVGMVLALLSVSMVQAQTGGALNYGTGTVGGISAEAPFAAYSFTAAQGDIVSIQVNSLAPGFSPSVSVNSPSGQQLGFSSSDPYSIGNGNARMDVLIAQAGTYNIQVGSANGGTGQFVIRLTGIQTTNAQSVPSDGTPLPLAFAETSAFQVVAVPQSPDGDQTLTLSGDEAAFSAAYFNAMGNLRDVLRPESGSTTSKTVPSGDGTYYVVVNNLDRAATTVELTLTSGDGPTEEASTAAPTPISSDVCTVTTGDGGTNLRGGPGTSYNVITTLAGGTSYPVTGQNNNWYTIDYNGQTGWLAGSVTTLTGPCANVPFVQAPPAPQVTTIAPTPTTPAAAPTEQVNQPPLPTAANNTGGDQQQQTQPTAPPPPTEPSVQVAPEDNSYFVEVSVKNGQATLSDFVSYPGGDVEDEIFWDVVDFDSVTTAGTLEVIITCNGEGASNLNFFSSGSNFSCGDIISRRVTNDSDSGLIRVTATGGDNIYVGYTLIFRGSN